MALAAASSGAHAATIVGTVLDRFDNVSFGNNDGPDDWSGPWIEEDLVVGGAGPSSGQVRVFDNAMRLTDYPDTGTEPSLAREVDLVALGALRALLRFDFATTAGVDPSDAVTVEVSGNGGGAYSLLETFTGITGATIGSREFDVTPYIGSATRVRFRVSNLYGGADEHFFADNVSIVATVPEPPAALLLTTATLAAGVFCRRIARGRLAGHPHRAVRPVPDRRPSLRQLRAITVRNCDCHLYHNCGNSMGCS